MSNEVNSMSVTHNQIKEFLVEIMLTNSWNRHDKKYNRLVIYKGDMIKFHMLAYYMGLIQVIEDDHRYGYTITDKGRRFMNVKQRRKE